MTMYATLEEAIDAAREEFLADNPGIDAEDANVQQFNAQKYVLQDGDIMWQVEFFAALKKVLEYAFTQDNVYRVTTGCLAENKGSERVMQKNGLIKEAEHIDYEWHDGKMKTRLEYQLLKHEWEQLQKTL